ncbi:MAG: IS630 family transposase, partial [Pseudomonadota bacterium]
ALEGSVTGRNMHRHRHRDVLRVRNTLEREIPAGTVVHAILDTASSQKTPALRRRLGRHPRRTVHVAPPSPSWPNAVEGVFATPTRRPSKPGVVHSVLDLQAAINRFIADHTATEAKPYVRRADPDATIAARARGVQALEPLL